ncbi:MAG TPA: hypothetical protein VNQ57_07810 [Ureibacillus sp.]|nr:hypothetical protein [Ureibacillus sp.]
MSQNKDFDNYSNFDDRGLKSKSSTPNQSTNSHQNTAKPKEEFGMEKNPLLNKIKNSSIVKKVEKFLNENK